MSKVIYHLSDWHTDDTGLNRGLQHELYGQPEHLRKPDLIIFTGDMVANSRLYRLNREAEGQRQKIVWDLMMQEAERWWPTVDMVAVRGNHDFFDLDHPVLQKVFKEDGDSFVWGDYKISGFQGVPFFGGSWNDEYEEKYLEEVASRIPVDTNVLLTHCPPYNLLDDAHDTRCLQCGRPVDLNGICPKGHKYPYPIAPLLLGSWAIKEVVGRLPNLKAHFFGHIHECGGRVETRGNVIFSNGACNLNVVVLP